MKKLIQALLRTLGYQIIPAAQLRRIEERYQKELESRASLAELTLRDLDPSDQETAGYLRQFWCFSSSRLGGSRSQWCQDLWVLFELQEVRRGFFVEFGASDGLRHSNSYLLEREYGWRGVLIEPVPEEFHKLKRNRPAALCLQGCISTRATPSRTLLVVPEDPQLASAESFHDKDLHSGQRTSTGIRIEVDEIDINAAIAAGRPDNDVVHALFVDTEGGEPDILRLVDFDRWKVLCICVEHNHRSADMARLRELMQEKGFSLAPFNEVSREDYWFIHRENVADVISTRRIAATA